MKISASIFNSLFFLLLAVTFTACDEDNVVIDNETETTIYLSSNTSGQVGAVQPEDDMKTETFEAEGTDSDGIYYDESSDKVYQVNRSDSKLATYTNVQAMISTGIANVNLGITSTSDFQNGRGLAVSGNSFIVAQDGSDTTPNQFVVYKEEDDKLSLAMTLETDINLWGLQMVGDDLYAIADNTNMVAIYNDFLSNDGSQMITADKVIAIEGLVRTHGIQYDAQDDVMILTDVGEAASGDDGAIFVIENWTSLEGNDMITASNYTRIAGESTMLGNPVDVEYDNTTKMIYVAERKRDGGLLLAFRSSARGNVAPDQMTTFEGASSLYLHKGNR